MTSTFTVSLGGARLITNGVSLPILMVGSHMRNFKKLKGTVQCVSRSVCGGVVRVPTLRLFVPRQATPIMGTYLGIKNYHLHNKISFFNIITCLLIIIMKNMTQHNRSTIS